MREVGRFPRALVCFCATCNNHFGWGKNEYLGSDFTCPDQRFDQKHIARVVLDEPPAFYWLRIEWFLYRWQTRDFLPAFLRKRCSSWEAGHSITLWFVLLGLALLFESQLAPIPGQWSRLVFVPLFAVRLVDVILTNLSITITSRFPANRLRTVVFTFSGYIQIVLAYAYFYAVGGKAWFPSYAELLDAIYFSFGTILTVGYGNLKPVNLIPRGLVVSELVLGLFFVVIIVAQVVGWSTQPDDSTGEFSLDQVSLRP